MKLSAEQKAKGRANVRKLFNSNQSLNRPDFDLPIITEDEQTYINTYGRINKRKDKARA